MRILITGKNGYIAKGLLKHLDNFKFLNFPRDKEIITVGRDDFDLTDRKSTNEWFKNEHKFDVVIHTAIVGGRRIKKDNADVFYQNISMFYNLLNNKDKFTKFIHFGSGAELGMPSEPYGLSKKIINELIKPLDNFYNIRIFGLFDEDELDNRFIKANIRRYINKESIEVYENKLMDFFYMEDLVSLVNYYITHPSPPKVSECSYAIKYSLLEIANIINNQSDYKVSIKQLGNLNKPDYIGTTVPDIKYIGLMQGILNVYNKLK